MPVLLKGSCRCGAVHFEVDGGARMRWMMHVTREGAALMGGLLVGTGRQAAPGGRTLYTSALAEMSNTVVSSGACPTIRTNVAGSL